MPAPPAPESGLAALPPLPDIAVTAEPLSRGPFAAIYRGWDRAHRCDVIVKVQRATGDPIAAERFRREAAVMKRLRHPNIVALYRFHDGDPAALVLEYVPGRTLAALVEAEGWLAPQRAAQVIEEVAAALDCAHAQGIIHRDVKPSNILLPPRAPARLFDFGVAHIDEEAPLTVMGDILGTIEYASPEQVHGNEAPDARSDVYSLAAVAYFALTKTPPFRAADNSTQAQLSVMHRQVFSAPPPLRSYREDLALAVEAAVLRGLAKAPASRYSSAGQFAAALRAAVEAEAGIPEHRAMAAARRTGAMTGAVAGAALLLLGALALWGTGQLAAPHPARVAQATKTPPKVAPAAPRPAAPVAVAQTPKPEPAVIPHPLHRVVAAQQPPEPVKTASRPKPSRPVLAHAHPKPARRLIAVVVPPAPPPPRPKPLRTPKSARLTARAVRPKAAPVVPARAAHTARQTGLYTVSGWVPIGAPGHTPALVRASAQWVKVDGRPVLALALGRWARLPAGRHVVTFQPTPALGIGPKTWNINLAAQAHLSQRIPFPSAPMLAVQPDPASTGLLSVSGWLPVTVPGQKPELVPIPAEWVKIDGKPSEDLAHGLWVSLPAGRHVIVFQPLPGSGADPATRVISLAPQARLNQLVPLPAAPLPATPPHLRNP